MQIGIGHTYENLSSDRKGGFKDITLTQSFIECYRTLVANKLMREIIIYSSTSSGMSIDL